MKGNSSKKTTYIRELKIKLVKSKYRNRVKQQIRSPKQVSEIFSDLKSEAKETLLGIYLNKKLTEGRHAVLNIGVKSELATSVEEILDIAILNRMPYIILVHNHPSGLIGPSDADLDFMQKIARAAEVTGRRLLDCIIVGLPQEHQPRYWSMYEATNGGKYPLRSEYFIKK